MGGYPWVPGYSTTTVGFVGPAVGFVGATVGFVGPATNPATNSWPDHIIILAFNSSECYFQGILYLKELFLDPRGLTRGGSDSTPYWVLIGLK